MMAQAMQLAQRVNWGMVNPANINIKEGFDRVGGAVLAGTAVMGVSSFFFISSSIPCLIGAGLSLYKGLKVSKVYSVSPAAVDHVGGAVILGGALSLGTSLSPTGSLLGTLVVGAVGTSVYFTKKNVFKLSSMASCVTAPVGFVAGAAKSTVKFVGEMLYAATIGVAGGVVAMTVDSLNRGQDTFYEGGERVMAGAFYGAVTGVAFVVISKVGRLVYKSE